MFSCGVADKTLANLFFVGFGGSGDRALGVGVYRIENGLCVSAGLGKLCDEVEI